MRSVKFKCVFFFFNCDFCDASFHSDEDAKVTLSAIEQDEQQHLEKVVLSRESFEKFRQPLFSALFETNCTVYVENKQLEVFIRSCPLRLSWDLHSL